MRMSKKSSTFATAFWVLLPNRVQRYNKKMKNTNYLVKKYPSYLVLLFAVLISGTMKAEINHYVGGFAHIGEWSMLPSESDYKASLGVAGGGGFAYEMQVGKKYSSTQFLLQLGLGVQGGLTKFSQTSSFEATLKDQKDFDFDPDPFDYVYQTSDRHDEYTDVALQIPIMVGVQHMHFYMLAGVKLYPHILTKSHSTAKLTTFGRSSLFDEKDISFHDMPEYQFFTNLPIESKEPTSLNFDIDASFEIGGRFGLITDASGFDVPKRKVEYRLALFADYGLLDLHSEKAGMMPLGTKVDGETLPLVDPNTGKPNLRYNEGATAPVYKTTSMIDNLVMTDVMHSEGFAAKVSNLMVGLKFTILFQLPEEGKCVVCQDNYRASVPRSSGRRGMQYEE